MDVRIGMPSDLRSDSRPGAPGVYAEGPSSWLTKLTVDVPASRVGVRTDSGTVSEKQKSRWRTLEFKLYGAAFVVVLPMMIWVPMRLSLYSHPNFISIAPKLSSGWFFGRLVDNSDPQYHSFRSGLPSLAGLAAGYLIPSTLYKAFMTRIHPATSPNRVPFICGFICAMQLILHGTSAFKVLVLVSANYWLSKLGGSYIPAKVFPAVLWAFNMAALFLNEANDGYKYESIHSALSFMDDYPGLLPRWNINFNITMLRLVSFGMDYHWAKTAPASAPTQPASYRHRLATSHSLDTYSYANFIAYALYPPLYIAGPIISFNDFTWQLIHPLHITRRSTVNYALRFLACLLTMEVVLHTMYVVAIKDTAAWSGDSAAELSMIGFWNLVVVWLKLLIPWRFFRLWALADGIDAPENMIRCVANNYSILGFWRSWHRSYNLWLIRYLYVPIGGNKNAVLSTLVIFTFVALWHDLSMRLLAWGWLVSLFIVPELAARHFVPYKKYGSEPWYRFIAGLGGVLNIYLLMGANLVGFVLGLDGTKYLLDRLFFTWDGRIFSVFASVCLFIGVQAMFEYREEETREGINRKC